ncbi:MAG: ankyrin repeat domain-containing protein [Gammaproteobacteria bacterium]|nr:ankyrin repeat domain-containing protein [Gammaproteobacteria bacterium]
MLKRTRTYLTLLLAIVALLFTGLARADVGIPALRIMCGKSSNKIIIEPFTIWDSGSPYPYDFETSQKTPSLVVGETTFYSLSNDVFNYKKPFTHLCRTKNRTVELTLYEAKLTVREGQDVSINQLGFDGSFDLDVYYLASDTVGIWMECFTKKDREERCSKFFQPINNNEDLVSFALHPDMIGSIERRLERGADINSRQRCGITALHVAASGGGVKMVKFLVERGARINERDCRGETPLGTAKRTRSYTRDKDAQNAVIDFLLQKGANE